MNRDPDGAQVAPGPAGLLDPAARKWLATARAQAALRGLRVDVIDGDDGAPEYVTSRWAFTRAVRSLQALAELLRLLGVQVTDPPGGAS